MTAPASVDFNLILILDPYCSFCSRRNKILRLHDPRIHLDEEAPDFHDDPTLWSVIHEEEHGRFRRHG